MFDRCPFLFGMIGARCGKSEVYSGRERKVDRAPLPRIKKNWKFELRHVIFKSLKQQCGVLFEHKGFEKRVRR